MFRRLLMISVVLSFTLLACKAAPKDANGGGGAGGDLLRDSCYVQLFDGDDFDATDHNFVLSRVGRYASLSELPGAGKDWTSEADSLRVGSAATVIGWSETNFEGVKKTYEAGSEHSSVVHEPASLELSCN